MNLCGTPGRAFAELLIDGGEDKYLRAVLVGMLRETEAIVASASRWEPPRFP